MWWNKEETIKTLPVKKQSKFQRGDVVVLQSGGLPMTVAYTDTGGDWNVVHTDWFCPNGRAQTAEFYEEELKPNHENR